MKNIPHSEVVDWATSQWEDLTGNKIRDPDRMIRKLHEEGLLVKEKTGVYRYDPQVVEKPSLEFSASQKEKIFERDGYRCVICGMGPENGVTLHADHVRPKQLGGAATVSNGQTLCGRHNNLKKTFQQTETGKKMFIRLYEIAKTSDDMHLLEFCKDVLEVYEKHNVNGHIQWKRNSVPRSN